MSADDVALMAGWAASPLVRQRVAFQLNRTVHACHQRVRVLVDAGRWKGGPVDFKRRTHGPGRNQNLIATNAAKRALVVSVDAALALPAGPERTRCPSCNLPPHHAECRHGWDGETTRAMRVRSGLVAAAARRGVPAAVRT